MITAPQPEECRVVELRRYTLEPGQRDVLISVFERELVEGQERAGMCLLGLFRDLDDPDQYVWLRGFRDMVERRDALTAFYGGPVWKANSNEANATMIDVDNVLLLRPLAPLTLPEPPAAPRPVTATIASIGGGDTRSSVADALIAAAADADWFAAFESLHEENTFPALPIREDADVVVLLAAGGDGAGRGEQLHLEPTARSTVR